MAEFPQGDDLELERAAQNARFLVSPKSLYKMVESCWHALS